MTRRNWPLPADLDRRCWRPWHAFLSLSPEHMLTIEDAPDECLETLDVTDCRDDLLLGGRRWRVGRGLPGLHRELVSERCSQPGFRFSDYDRIDQEILEEIDDAYTRNLIIAFTNEHYEPWRDKDVSVPDYDDIRRDCRDFCDDCESGWTDIHGEYDGPLADDVEDDEDEDEQGIGEEKRDARQQRNEEREEERDRRHRAQEDAESEVVDREFTLRGGVRFFLRARFGRRQGPRGTQPGRITEALGGVPGGHWGIRHAGTTAPSSLP